MEKKSKTREADKNKANGGQDESMHKKGVFLLKITNKLIDSNLVIENRELSRFIKPVSSRVVNKVNIATLERKDTRIKETLT